MREPMKVTVMNRYTKREMVRDLIARLHMTWLDESYNHESEQFKADVTVMICQLRALTRRSA